jgi:nitrite reductase/ring-hydroxylating ferredoxin subunit
MRVRLVLVLAVVLVAFVAAGTVVALWGGGPGRTGVITERLADLAVGNAKEITVELPDARHTEERVFLARTADREVHAYLAKSTHLGCRLLLPADAQFTMTTRRTYFEDPCGGSVYSFEGRCSGGPCPRDLDHYAVEVRDDRAEIDLRHLVKGSARGT